MVIFKSDIKDLEIPNVPLFERVYRMCDIKGDKPAIVDGFSGFTLTYSQLKQYTSLVSLNLQHRFQFGLDEVPGTSVLGIMLPNHPFYPVLFHGVNMAGGANTTINPLYTEDEIQKQIIDSKAKLFVTVDMFLEKSLKAVKGTNVTHVFVLSANPVETRKDTDSGVTVLDFKALLAPPQSDEQKKLIKVPQIDPKKHLCVLPYSSGTTGLSKGVFLTHHNLVANLLQVDPYEHIGEDGKIVAVLPFFHIYGMLVILCKCFDEGATCVTMPKFDLEQFLRIVQEHGITRAHLVPPIILALSKHPLVDKYDLTSLQAVTSGAAPLSKELHLLFNERHKSITIKQGYGMTESSPVISVCPDDDVVVGSSGKILPNTEIRIIDTSTEEEVGVGKEGEIVVRGPQVMVGYLNNEEATKHTLREGWLHTGDVGYVDERGHLYVVDRVKELIKYNGYQVPPAQLEGILQKMDGVADVAVIGVPDDVAGELPKAFVVKKEGSNITEEDVMEYVSALVSPQKRIRLVEFIDAIPKSASGKILRRLLKDRK